MNVNDSIGSILGLNKRPTSRSRVSKKTNINIKNEAVRVEISPYIFNSKEYQEILKENNRYPIINPDVLLYDDRLYLRRYSKS